MKVRLLTVNELSERLLKEQLDSDHLPLCTAIDVLELGELIRKGRVETLPQVFLVALSKAVDTGSICIEGLDGYRLLRNMFEDYRDSRTTLWAPARDSTISTGKTTRRLILRVSSESWWDYEQYQEMDDRDSMER